MSRSPTDEPVPDKADDNMLQEKIDELEKLVLSLAMNVHKIKPPQKQETFKKDLTNLLAKLEEKSKLLSQSGE
jgi:TATA-binding protein-associated factor Taf7